MTMAETSPNSDSGKLVVASAAAVGSKSEDGGEKASSSTALPAAVEFEPPLACVRRILKNALPSSTNVGKDASAAFARACGIFIIYITACANDFAREHKRQTITANDVLAAMKELEFGEFTPDMMNFLENYRTMEKTKKDAKAKANAKKSIGGASSEPAAAAATLPVDGVAGEAAFHHHDHDDDDDDDDDEHDDDLKTPPRGIGGKRTREEEEDDDDDDDDDDEHDDHQQQQKRFKSAAAPEESDDDEEGEEVESDQETE